MRTQLLLTALSLALDGFRFNGKIENVHVEYTK